MEFRILGPLEAWDGGCEVSLGGPKPRALLAVLLLHPNEVVSADRLIDEIWGEDSPERAAAAPTAPMTAGPMTRATTMTVTMMRTTARTPLHAGCSFDAAS